MAREHEIGVHSWEHASMSMETDSYVAADAIQCYNWYRATFGRAPAVYAFPNGMAREGQAEIIRDAGFPHVLLTGENFSSVDEWQHRRFTFYAEDRSEARLRAVGTLCRPRAAAARTSHSSGAVVSTK